MERAGSLISNILPNAHHFSIQNPFFLNSSIEAPDHNLGSFAIRYTISGAHYDSSARQPPPRCHLGTRKRIVEQTLRWFLGMPRTERVLWLIGPAGAGKSAIMQTLTEQAATKSILGAALFFSAAKGHNQSAKVFTTLAYQLAAKHPTYHSFLCGRLKADPLLPEKSIATQFSELIVEPLARCAIHLAPNDVAILIDGLDECKGEREQLEIAGLITYFTITYPSAPVRWIIASRSEPHIMSFLSRKSVSPIVIKEELLLDSTEACRDTERYLRDELVRIKRSYLATSFLPQWPAETHIQKITSVGTGLFAYIATVISFVDDYSIGNPISQLQQVLDVIENRSDLRPATDNPHPMKQLDALYTCILSQVPKQTLQLVKVLFRHYLPYGAGPSEGFALTCNWLGFTPDVVFGALHRLSSIFDFPTSLSMFVLKHRMGFRHQSFCDYLSDPIRSGSYSIASTECIEQDLDCTIRILSETSAGHYSEITLTTSNADSRDHGGRQFLYTLASTRCIVFGLNGPVNIVEERLRDPRFIHALKVMEYSDQLDFEIIMRATDYFNNESIRSLLKKNQIIEELPIAGIDLGAVQKLNRGFVRYCSSKLDHTILPQDGWCKGPSGPFHDYKGPDKQHDVWSWRKEATLNCQCMVDAWRNLEKAQRHPSEKPVVFWGNMTGGYLILDYVLDCGPFPCQVTTIIPYRL